jgi:hypothetical protein
VNSGKADRLCVSSSGNMAVRPCGLGCMDMGRSRHEAMVTHPLRFQ